MARRQPRYGKNPEAGRGISYWVWVPLRNTPLMLLDEYLSTRSFSFLSSVAVRCCSFHHTSRSSEEKISVPWFLWLHKDHKHVFDTETDQLGSEAPRTDSSSGTNPIPRLHPRDIVSSLPRVIREEVGLRYSYMGIKMHEVYWSRFDLWGLHGGWGGKLEGAKMEVGMVDISALQHWGRPM
jgi:hypothetical protein